VSCPPSYDMHMVLTSTIPSRRNIALGFLTICLLASAFLPAYAQGDKTSGSAKTQTETSKTPVADKQTFPPLPADKQIAQSMTLAGKTLRYTVTVGKLPVRNKDGKIDGELVYTAYTVDGDNRPVTFAVNGGPGASSVFLNFGAIGPKHLSVGNEGDSASDSPTLTDNPGTWLNFTDLVFLDPIGTGFSRSLVSEADAKKEFYSTVPDIHYLSQAIYDWLVKNDRMTSRKYLVGESYGGFRGPRILYYLQSQLGVALNGVVLVSPFLNPESSYGGPSPISWMETLPPITAAHLEREHKLTPEAMADVIAYTEGPYATALIEGRSNPAATQAMIQHVTEMTGLDPTFVKQSGGRLETGAYLREVHREQGKLGSVYDSNVTSYDPFPYRPHQEANDPILAAIVAPTTEAMVNFVTNTVGWKTDAQYHTLSYQVSELWDRDAARSGSATQLRQAVAADPKLRVLIVHGWNDLSCPFMGSALAVDQMPVMGDPTRVAVHEFPGGHMFYTRLSSREALQKDVMEMYSRH
jgi:carboxypeptidase C (cathepsin A)